MVSEKSTFFFQDATGDKKCAYLIARHFSTFLRVLSIYDLSKQHNIVGKYLHTQKELILRLS